MSKQLKIDKTFDNCFRDRDFLKIKDNYKYNNQKITPK